jgi:transposase
MRYELTDYEWAAIKPFLPNKPRGVPRLNDRRVLNGIFWVLRSGCAVARPASELWPVHHLLQSLRSLAAGGCVGQAHERNGQRP